MLNTWVGLYGHSDHASLPQVFTYNLHSAIMSTAGSYSTVHQDSIHVLHISDAICINIYMDEI